MKQTTFFLIAAAVLLISACNGNKSSSDAKGELAFLLQHGGKLPSDVGFLTNHVVERRLANILKDKFDAFANNKTVCEMPILVIDSNLVVARYKACDNDVEVKRNICIDVRQDAFWISTFEGGKANVMADHSKLPMPRELMNFKVN